MSEARPSFPEIQSLVDQMIDGTIQREDLERLEHVLDGNAELQKSVFQYSQVHLSLHCDVRSKNVVDRFIDRQRQFPEAASGEMSTGEMPNDATPAGYPFNAFESLENEIMNSAPAALPPAGPAAKLGGISSWQVAIVFCLGIATALIGTEAVRRERNSDGPLPPATAPVAFLTSSNGCSWGSDSLKLQTVGSTVQLGEEIALQQGIAEFRLANGVYLSVEGPAGLVLNSVDSIVLQYGKLTMHVPWPVSEFRVLAGACRLAATDAEFGVSVTGGRVDTHVFSGEVVATNALAHDADSGDDIQRAATDRSKRRFTSAAIGQGQALVVVNQNSQLRVLRWEKATPHLFATKLTMAGPLPVSDAYCETVKASGPVGYWRFESTSGGMVRSEVTGAPDLMVKGDMRLSGVSGNRVAEFRPGSDCYLISGQPFDALAKTEYSAEIWMKPSHVHCGSVLGMVAIEPETGREKCAFLLEVESSINQQVRNRFSSDHPYSIRYLHRDPPDRSHTAGHSCFSKSPYSIRRWQHVVAVKKADSMELYIDGKLSAQATDRTLLAPDLHMIVGRQDTLSSDIQFIGQLDELAVYPRALTVEEIKAHYRAINWKETQSRNGEEKDS